MSSRPWDRQDGIVQLRELIPVGINKLAVSIMYDELIDL